jgi:hypothetical protein
MANTVRLKRSAVQGKAPATTDLELGELAVNTYDGKLYIKKDDGTAAIVEIGETNVDYNGASAWGKINSDATVAGGVNIASITTSTVNTVIGFNLTFTNPMPSADYAVTASALNNNRVVVIESQDANGFRLELKNPSNNGVLDDFSFIVFATNALPPEGGTGTDAWGTTSDSVGTVSDSFNIERISQTVKPDGTTVAQSNGIYYVKFSSPMPTNNYCCEARWDNSCTIKWHLLCEVFFPDAN